jgi:C-terminal processing protease CtpA/Prc
MGKDDDEDDITSNQVDTKDKKVLSNKLANVWRTMLTKIINAFPTLRIAIASFTVGALMALIVVFVPVYTSVDKMSEQVTLFETILSDLDRGYVDPVDQNKLFQTGVNAMLKSLDPYTEFEGKEDAQELNESVQGRYAGIGLVISGPTKPKLEQPIQVNAVDEKKGQMLPKDALEDNTRLLDDDNVALDDDDFDVFDDELDREDIVKKRLEERKANEKARERGIRVVNAFEGYAFDYGMRAGDKLVAIDGWNIPADVPVEEVRNRLRGPPETSVDITFERVGVDGLTTLTIPRRVVQISDVKLATIVGKPQDGIGYIQLTGFTSNCGRDVRNAIFALQAAAEEASAGKHSLQVGYSVKCFNPVFIILKCSYVLCFSLSGSHFRFER